MNVRMVNSVFEDRGKPDFDPEANTDRFLRQVPDYAAHGVNAFTLCLQGGMPGYEGRSTRRSCRMALCASLIWPAHVA